MLVRELRRELCRVSQSASTRKVPAALYTWSGSHGVVLQVVFCLSEFSLFIYVFFLARRQGCFGIGEWTVGLGSSRIAALKHAVERRCETSIFHDSPATGKKKVTGRGTELFR